MALVEGTEVAKHNSPGSCWVVISGKVWDVTTFLDDHPGGGEVILRYAGRDATAAYDAVHHPELVVETMPADTCLGELKPGTLEAAAKPPGSISSSSSSQGASAAAEFSSEQQRQQRGDNKSTAIVIPPLTSILNVSDFEKVARDTISPQGWSFYAGGAEDEICLHDSRRLYRKMPLRARILRNVDHVSTATTILGFASSLPVYVSPTGRGRYVHPEAEQVLASVATDEGISYGMPTRTGGSVESIFRAMSTPAPGETSALDGGNTPRGTPFLQLYANRDRAKSALLIRKAESLGAGAVFFTVDSCVMGRRERDDRQRLAAGEPVPLARTGSNSVANLLDPSCVWSDLAWLRSVTSLPVVVKGIQSVEDAVLAHGHGARGIVLSNHGGRSLDTSQAPILTLLEIRRHAPHLVSPETRDSGRFQVFVDGGVRRGTDVMKALALGATAVGMGRPWLYSLAGGYGAEGTRRLVAILRSELETNMALVGARTVRDLVPEMVNTERAEREVSRMVKL